MYVETERRIFGKSGHLLQCKLQVQQPEEIWPQEPEAIQKIEDLFLSVFGELAETELNGHDLDTFCAGIKQAIWDWEHKQGGGGTIKGGAGCCTR